ncbi:MAG: recombination mediator RecR [Bacteroidales bacterium]|nr:recombination mediator RecR [Bacteroidales bacterium]
MNDIQLPSKHLELAVNEISKLPGIGKKNALRLALYILKQNEDFAKNLSESIVRLKTEIHFCKKCHTISDNDLCDICSNPMRDNSTVCVVENIKDVLLVERTNQYKGLYHVLGGVISPIEGISPMDLNITSLMERIATGEIKEVIFALPVTTEGDTTSFYLFKKLQNYPSVKISMLARGVSVGDELEYTDEATLARSLKDRVVYSVTL